MTLRFSNVNILHLKIFLFISGSESQLLIRLCREKDIKKDDKDREREREKEIEKRGREKEREQEKEWEGKKCHTIYSQDQISFDANSHLLK